MLISSSTLPVVLANVPWEYQVTAPPSAAPYHSAIAGIAFALAFVSAGFWLLRNQSLSRQSSRLALWVVAGAVSIGWGGAWLRQHNGDYDVRVSNIWDLAPALPTLWVAILIVVMLLTLREKMPAPLHQTQAEKDHVKKSNELPQLEPAAFGPGEIRSTESPPSSSPG